MNYYFETESTKNSCASLCHFGYLLHREAAMVEKILHKNVKASAACQGLFQQFWEKAPVQIWEKMIDLTSKLGEINEIEHYKGSKI